MEDGAEIVEEVGSHVEEKKLAEDTVYGNKVEKSELAGSDESRDAEDEVFEEVIGSREDLPDESQKPESFAAGRERLSSEIVTENSKEMHEVEDFEEASGTLDEMSSNDDHREDVKVGSPVVAESGSEANVVNRNDLREAETVAVTLEIDGGSQECGVGINQDMGVSNGQAELDLNTVENPEKADSIDSNILLDLGNMENGNGIRSPGEKELGPDVISKDAEAKESKDNYIKDGDEKATVDASFGNQFEQCVKDSDERARSHSEKGLVCEGNASRAHKNGEVEVVTEACSSHFSDPGDYRNTNTDARNTSGKEKSEIYDGTGIEEAGSLLSSEKSVAEERGEIEGHRNGLKSGDLVASPSSSTNIKSTAVQLDNAVADGNDGECEPKQSTNGEHNSQHKPQGNRENEQQQNDTVNIERKTEGILQVNGSHEDQPAMSSASSTESRNDPVASPPTRPAGLGRAAPLLEPAPRVPQQPRANGNASHSQAQNVEDSATAETDEHDETREKLQMIRVKFLRLAHRLGQTPHNVVVAQVLYRLGLAEQLRGRNGSRVGAFSYDRASAMAEQLEAAGQEPLDFSCTIMVLGKSGVGKSATINSIFDDRKFDTDAFQMGTKKVQDVEGFVQGIRVRVIDTPGLLPSWSDLRQNEKILHSVRRFIKKTPPDIVLYLDRLDMQSRDFGDMPLLRTITDIFGPSIWFNAIVVLTHAASAPPDGPNGTPSSYDMFVTQRSHVIQQAIRQAAGDMRLMNPVSLVENHSACRTNRAGQRVLPNGQVWKPHLLLLSFASKILAEANALLKLQDNVPGRPFAARPKSPPLPFLLSSLLQSRPQVKLPDEQYGDEDNGEDDLDESSDSDEESEYDQLPPFKRLTKAQMAKLSRAQKKQYLDELEYREKLFMKKQLKEERKRRKMMKKLAAELKDSPEYTENVEEESAEPASVPVPMPDLALPASFDSDNPTHRYRYLDSSNQWLVRPVLETHGWDHDVGYEGVNVERLFVVKEKIPVSFSGQVTKDKKDANVQMELAGSMKHGEGKSTSLGFDMQNVGKELAYTLRSEMRFNNFRKMKAAAGLSVTLLGDSLSAGVKIEDKLIANKRFRLVLSGGAMTGRGDVAYGGSLEAQLRDKDYPLGRFLSTLGLSVMDWHGDLAIGGNIQSQLPVGRSTNLIARANLNNRGAGQLSIRLNSSEQLQIALIAVVPLFKKLLNYSQQVQYGQ